MLDKIDIDDERIGPEALAMLMAGAVEQVADLARRLAEHRDDGERRRKETDICLSAIRRSWGLR